MILGIIDGYEIVSSLVGSAGREQRVDSIVTLRVHYLMVLEDLRSRYLMVQVEDVGFLVAGSQAPRGIFGLSIFL